MKKRLTILVLIFIGIIATSVTIYSKNIKQKIKSKTLKISQINKANYQNNLLDKSFTLVAVGDIMLGSCIPDGWIPPNNDCTPFFKPFLSHFTEADIMFGNFEGVFSDTKVGAKKCNDPKWCWTFGMPTKYVNCFVDAGFDILNLANNHSKDFGTEGIKNTIKILQDNKINFAGVEGYPFDTMTRNGVKIGFCGFAPGGANYQITDIAGMQKIVKHLDTICDIVIVSFHGGAEGPDHEHVTSKDEFYLEQNRGNVYIFAHKAIEAGGDIILGHGPHVTRAVEIYNDRLIVYSMGNFATFHFVRHGPYGMAPIFKIFTDKTGKFEKAQIISVKPTVLGPEYDSTFAALKKIQQLTKADFPEKTNIIIGDDGWILPN